MSGTRGPAAVPTGATQQDFENYVAQMASEVAHGRDVADALFSIIRLIEPLGSRERERRLGRAVEILGILPDALRDIAMRALQTDTWTLNALLQLLPPAHRQMRSTSPTVAATVVAPTAVVPAPTEIESNSFRAVALVGLPDEHANNRFMLQQAELDPLSITDLEMLESTARSGLCGVVIGKTFWGQLDASLHESALRRICEISTVVFYRVCTAGLAPRVASELFAIQRRAANGEMPSSRFCQGETGDINMADVQEMRKVANLHASALESTFFPAELSNEQGTLLQVLCGQRAASRPRSRYAKTLKTKSLTGGRSKAQLILAIPDGGAKPIVLKFHQRAELDREIDAFHRWIDSWDGCTAPPVFHSHLGCHALSYRLESAVDAPYQPARTLQDCLEQLRFDEAFTNDPARIPLIKTAGDDLYSAIKLAVEALDRLNEHAADAEGYGLWIQWPFNNLVQSGVDITVTNTVGQRVSVAELVVVATHRASDLQHAAVAHGDIHGRNILIRDRSPVFIDFDQSGPGHPCLDLARLDGVLRNTLFRCTESEAKCVSFCHRLYVDGADYEQLALEFPELVAPITNSVWAKSAVQIRQTCTKLADKFGGSALDFLAMSTLVASYNLALLVPGSGIERALLGALSGVNFNRVRLLQNGGRR